MSRLQAIVVLTVLLMGAFTEAYESFGLPTDREWLPRRPSKEPIDGINAALQTMLPLMEPLRPSERQALQKLANTVSRTLGKNPATRTEKDYADIMSAARKFVQVFQKPRSERHTTHDVRVLQVFTSWVYYTVEAFRDSALGGLRLVWQPIREGMNEAWDRMDKYVRETRKGTAPQRNYASYWNNVDDILDDLLLLLKPVPQT
ncbi:unnamed protein product [Heligmosomoides polygyrus]|uniref:Secreted protein n=1 Tax=Heligmosomoides polygyrus TaxID=6339 RepID=A0A183GPU5_HELPZ|nr:unnamed protein product [Heligmosomoides polygyrus]